MMPSVNWLIWSGDHGGVVEAKPSRTRESPRCAFTIYHGSDLVLWSEQTNSRSRYGRSTWSTIPNEKEISHSRVSWQSR